MSPFLFQAAVIDAQHDFFNVVGETMALLRQIPCCVETIVYHDYCQLEEGVQPWEWRHVKNAKQMAAEESEQCI